VFLIEEKEEIARNRIIKEFDGSDIQVLNGRYGPYISDGKLNGRIPKDREPASLTLEDVVRLMEETGKPMRKGFGKKAPAKKAATKKAPATKTATKTATKKTATKKAASKTVGKPAKKTAKKATRKVAVKKAASGDDDAPF
jgi:DNA topoisomerase-1